MAFFTVCISVFLLGARFGAFVFLGGLFLLCQSTGGQKACHEQDGGKCSHCFHKFFSVDGLPKKNLQSQLFLIKRERLFHYFPDHFSYRTAGHLYVQHGGQCGGDIGHIGLPVGFPFFDAPAIP